MKNIKSNKQKTQKVLATLVMGMNLVNTVTPVAVAMQNVPEQIDVLPVPTQTEAQPLEYTFLPHTLNFVDSVIFSKAEAKDIPAGKVDKLEDGDEMKVPARQVGEVEINNNGTQTISGGGLGKIGTQFQGTQTIETGGSGYIKRCFDGVQEVSAFGNGIIDTMNFFRKDPEDLATLQMISKNGFGKIETMNGGCQLIWDGKGRINTMNSGVQNVSDGVGNINIMNDGLQVMYGGATGRIAEQKGGEQVISFGVGIIEELKGGLQQINSRGSSLDTTMSDGVIAFSGIGGKLINATVHGGVVFLPDNSTQGENYTFGGNFTFDGGLINMARGLNRLNIGEPLVFKDIDSYETLTIENLKKGGGTFVMNTDLESEKDSDKITIKNADAGTSYVKVVDKSLQGTKPVSANKKLLLITVENGKADFVGKEINKGGLWSVTPTIKNGKDIGESDKDWYLINISKTVTKDTKVLLEDSDNAYALWRNTNDTMRKRLGELHLLDNAADGDGIWARYTGGKFGADSFDASYHMYQLGYDKADNDKSTYGFALEKGSASGSYGFGNSKDKLFAGSFYGVWTGEDGSYTDVTAKLGQLSSDIKSQGEYPDKADYKNRTCSLSVEYGKKIVLDKYGAFVEPQAQFVVGRMSGADYTTERGNKVQLGGVNSYIGRLGFVLGQKAESGNEVYFKASVLREFGGNRDVQMQAANGDNLDMSKDYGDTWFELGLGTNIKLSKASYFYGDIERSFGADIKKRWQINAGLRFSF